MALKTKVPIFADTNLGTHIALDVNPTLKAADFKRELEEAHLNCFPKLGNIKINGLMVKKKSNFYHIPDSLRIKHVFQGTRGLWLIHIEACLLSEILKSTSRISDVMLWSESRNCVLSYNVNYTNYKMEKLGMKRILCPKVVPSSIGLKKCHVSKNEGGCTTSDVEENIMGAILENHSEAVSEAVSVSGIIKKYFCEYEDKVLKSEVTSRTCSNVVFSKKNSNFTPKTPAKTSMFSLNKDSKGKSSKKKCRSGEFGKRILVATNELGRFKSMPKFLTGLYRCNGQKSSGPIDSSLIKSLVFEISDNE